jgi:hypothetical protein
MKFLQKNVCQLNCSIVTYGYRPATILAGLASIVVPFISSTSLIIFCKNPIFLSLSSKYWAFCYCAV